MSQLLTSRSFHNDVTRVYFRQDVYSDSPQTRFGVGHLERVVEHLFEMNVTSIHGLRLLDDMIWGEADCFVQYHFPAQAQLKQQGAPDIANGTPLKYPYFIS